ncbi:MAG: ABC transporter substrate-binding protein [Campylobacterota bacterium]
MKKYIFILLFLCINLFGSHRVVTLAPSINEIVFALGMGENVVANTMYCDFPKESKSVTKLGGYANISLEKILKANPTVVLAQNYDVKLHNNLEKLGIKLLVFKTQTIEDIKNTINVLGEYFQKENRANELIKNIDNALKSLEYIVENKKVLIVISPNKTLSNQIYVSGNYLYFEDIIKASGNKNAFYSKSKSQPVVNTEKVIKMNPDIIVLLAPFLDNKPKQRENIKKMWKTLPISASKDDNIYTVHKSYAGIPSQRVVYFIKDFKKILENVRDK